VEKKDSSHRCTTCAVPLAPGPVEYERKGEFHEPIPEYGVDNAPLSKGALSPSTMV